jgi:hypothetical protein
MGGCVWVMCSDYTILYMDFESVDFGICGGS